MKTRYSNFRAAVAFAILRIVSTVVVAGTFLASLQIEVYAQNDVGQAATSRDVTDLETIRARILAPLVKPVSTDAAGKLVEAQLSDGSWPDVDYSDRRRSSWRTPTHLTYLATLSMAYKSPQSELRGDAELRAAILAGLDYWFENDFQNPNWWWNQIGVPRTLAPVLLLMEDELSEDRLGRGLDILRRAKIGMTGQNLVWVTQITALRGILENDTSLVATAYRRIAEEIRVGSGEGIQADFSFHQHGACLYSHGYGAVFAVDCPRIATQVAGTQMAFPPEKIDILGSLILDGSQWMTRGVASDFGAEGREITRMGQTAGYLASAAGYMLQLPTGREDEFRALAARASGEDAPPLQGNRHFWRSDIMTHHRTGYYASARMFSQRIVNTDAPCNSEGLRSHHVADGCNAIMRTGREYHEIYPVWDWQKIPGTTVEQRSELTGTPRRQGKRSFVGGVSDGTYGMAAFDFAHQSLTARKSWFFFDGEFVCLGTGITCESENPVVTTLNQCNLVGDVTLAVNGEVRELDRTTHDLNDPAWVWHDGIAYVFLNPAPVRLQNDVQRGSWHYVNQRYSQDEITRDVFSLWIDHGKKPANGGYAYIVVPGIEISSLAGYADSPPVTVLQNDVAIQAVRHQELGITQIAFHEAGSLDVDGHRSVGVDTPCLVMLREDADGLSISLSNPANEKAKINVDISGRPRMAVDLPDGSSLTRILSKSLAHASGYYGW